MPKQKKLGVEIALILTGDNRYALHQGLVLSIDISRRSCFLLMCHDLSNDFNFYLIRD